MSSIIKHSQAFFDNLKTSNVSEIFYHFNTLSGLTQYELLFREVNLIQDKGNIKVLDWGCGNGWFSYYLIKTGFKDVTSYYYGWDDISPAKERIPELNVVNGAECNLKNASLLPFEDATFDIVFSIGVLEHVHETGGDQLKSLNEIKRILKPGGRFMCFHFPNKYTWIEYIKGIVGGSKVHIHSKKFTKSDIKTLAGDSGFDVVKVKRYNLLPYNLLRYTKSSSKLLASSYSFMDRLLSSTPLNIFSQCYYFIAKKS
jgi:ubiquinone/menaquinone biosynthesis C-methylase UbiE